MTETELKLRDAAAQMLLALKQLDDQEALRSCINSFISHGRSVTFVMQRESADNADLVRWYQQRMTELRELPLLQFFNAKRVYSVHRGVVQLRTHTAPIWNLRVNGELLPGVGEATFHGFDGVAEYLPGDSGNVFRLCEEYYVILHQLVSDWLQRRVELGLGS